MSRILFSLLLSLSYNCLQANIRDLLLSDKQYDSVIFLVNNAKLNESVEVELRKNQENDPSLKMLTFSDILKVYNLIKPVNFKTYKDSLVQYNICKKLAVGLAEKVINDISSETANQKIPLSRYLNFEKGIYFKNNLTLFKNNFKDLNLTCFHYLPNYLSKNKKETYFFTQNVPFKFLHLRLNNSLYYSYYIEYFLSDSVSRASRVMSVSAVKFKNYFFNF